MAYRNDVEALEARHAALAAELGEKARERDEVGQLLVEARARQVSDAYVQDLDAGGPARRRRRRRKIAFIVCLTMAVAGAIGLGYRHHVTSSARAEFEATYSEFSKFTDDMCRCTTGACAQQVSDTMTKWATDMVKRYPKPPPPPADEDLKRFTTLAERMAKCMMTAMTPAQDQDRPIPDQIAN